VTVDDDWASKEVRMGYSLYRDVVQYPKASSLIQAIGISESSLLTPTVQLSILDENCVILLCSDGLSDFNRVEQYGLSLIAPILAGTVDVATVGHQLIALANELNGHDNVTLSLIHCQSELPADQRLPTLDYDRISEALKAPLPADSSAAPFFLTPDPSLEKITPPSKHSRLWIWAIAWGLLIVTIVGLARLVLRDSSGVLPEVKSSPEPSPSINP
jgi:protein phosphatase